MEIFLLGVVVGVVGAKGNKILKPLARGYLELADRAREWGAEVRENFEDALEEARYEREQETAARDEPTPVSAEAVSRDGHGAESASAERVAR